MMFYLYLTVLLFLARRVMFGVWNLMRNNLKRLSFIILTSLLSACGSDRREARNPGMAKRSEIASCVTDVII